MSDKDAIAYFNKTYVATDIFPREFAERQYETAEYILESIRAYLNEKQVLG